MLGIPQTVTLSNVVFSVLKAGFPDTVTAIDYPPAKDDVALEAERVGNAIEIV